MLIDWFTVGAQILNFLVLVWLLRRFLYRPILQAIDAREKRIAAELAQAAAKNASAEAVHADFEEKTKAFEEQRGALLATAVADAGVEHKRLLDEARKAGEALRTLQGKALQVERANLGKAIARQASDEVFAIARKVLDDLSTTSLEERMSEVFTRRLREMEGGAKAALGAALAASAEAARVQSRFELPPGPRAAIQNALNETFSAEVRIAFETSANASCGIEMSVGGQQLAWSIGDALGTLERQVGALLDAHAPPAAATKPEPAKAPARVPVPDPAPDAAAVVAQHAVAA